MLVFYAFIDKLRENIIVFRILRKNLQSKATDFNIWNPGNFQNISMDTLKMGGDDGRPSLHTSWKDKNRT